MAGSKSQRPGTNLQFLFAFVLLSVFSVSGQQFWDGAISYEPPFPMLTNSQPAQAGASLGTWKFYTVASNTNGLAEVAFHRELLATFLAPDNASEAIHNISDLKRFLDSKLARFPFGTNYLTAIGELAGQQAITCVTRTNSLMGKNSNWFFSSTFFWKSDAIWQKSEICVINIIAERSETFHSLTNSLESIKVQRASKKN